jgi:hypothetical protein
MSRRGTLDVDGDFVPYGDDEIGQGSPPNISNQAGAASALAAPLAKRAPKDRRASPGASSGTLSKVRNSSRDQERWRALRPRLPAWRELQ